MDVSVLQLTHQSFVNSSHASVRMLCVQSSETVIELPTLLDEASAGWFRKDPVTTDGQSWIGEDLTQVQVVKAIARIRKRGWKIMAHDVVSAASEQNPGLTILVRNFFFEKVGDITSFRDFADEGQDKLVAAGVGPAAHAINATDAVGAGMLAGTLAQTEQQAPHEEQYKYEEQQQQYTQDQAAAYPTAEVSDGSGAHPTAPVSTDEQYQAAPAEPVGEVPYAQTYRVASAEPAPDQLNALHNAREPAPEPVPQPRSDFSERDASFFSQQLAAKEAEDAQREQQLAAMDDEQRAAALAAEESARTREKNKSKHYQQLGRTSTSATGRSSMFTSRRGRGRKK